MGKINFSSLIEKFRLAKDILAGFNEEARLRQLDREHQVRLKDLHRVMYRVGKVALPPPTLFSLQWLADHFGDLDKIDIAGPRDLATVIWILENQADFKHVAGMSPDEVYAAINERMSQMPASSLTDYQVAVHEIFEQLKKNSREAQIKTLEDLKTMLEADLDSFPPGVSRLSDLLKRLEDPSSTSTLN